MGASPLLGEHLCEKTEHRPATLTRLQPLYQAVAHGCLAGLQQQACDDVYINRILRGTEAGGFYSSRKLGAIGADLGAVACFFATPWTTLAPKLTPGTQRWLFNEAATRLQALGRLTEAAAPMRACLEMEVQAEDWKESAIVASNLSGLELTLGEVSEAVTTGQQSVTYADRSEDAFQQRSKRVGLADALHQAGLRAESRRMFEDAEASQAASEPEYPRFYSVQGFVYCDLLLSDAECATWQHFLNVPLTCSNDACDGVIERALQWSDWRTESDSLLEIALEVLILARALLYKLHSTLATPQAATDYVTEAVAGLRAAGYMGHLPLGLLTQAWLRCLSGDEQGCLEDLDEAWEIAERGPMPLHQADIQLTRARLFRDSAALAEARRLIEKHGYHRRDGELADAETAAKGWRETPMIEILPDPEPTPSEESIRDQVFISYSHSDQKLMGQLLTHLKPYLRGGVVTAWSDQQISPGSKWFDEIQSALAKTSVAVLLVSPDFLASDFIHEHELTPLLKEAEAGGVKILWVQLRACAYEETPLQHYQAVVSPPDKPLAEMKGNRDQAWVRLCKEIKKATPPPPP